MPLLILAQGEREIRGAVEFTKEQGVKMILLGGSEAWKVKELLVENGIPVILGPTQRLPGEEDEAYDQPFTTPGETPRRRRDGGLRHLRVLELAAPPLRGGARGGLRAPAGGRDPGHHGGSGRQLFGLAEDFGTLEEGKVANLIVVNGDPLRDPDRGRARLRERGPGLARQPPPEPLREVPGAPATRAIAGGFEPLGPRGFRGLDIRRPAMGRVCPRFRDRLTTSTACARLSLA